MLKYRNLTKLLEDIKKSGKGIILIESETEEIHLSYDELYNKASEILAALQKKGVQPGDEVIFQLQDNFSFLITFWGCILGGIIPIPVPEGRNEENRLKLLKIWKTLNRPHLIISKPLFESYITSFKAVSEENDIDIKVIEERTFFIEEVKEVKEKGKIYDGKPSDIALIQFSSGSTGDPKGVILTNENILTNIQDIVTGVACVPEDSTLSWMPLTHDMGLIGFHLSSIAGDLDQYIMPTPLFIRKPALWMSKTTEHKISIIASPNFGYKLLLGSLNPEAPANWDLSNVRLVLNGAEPISGELCNKFLDAMSYYKLKQNVIFPVYGLAEASLAVTFPPIGETLSIRSLNKDSLSLGEVIKVENNPKDSIDFVDLGYPVQNCFVRICDEDNKLVGDKVIGFIQIMGKNVSKGYYNNSKATEAAISKDGWMITGDVGFLDSGRLIIIGRAKDIIFVNGQNYYPHDIEQRLSSFVKGEVAACGIPNDITKADEISIFALFNGTVEEFIPLAIDIKSCINKTMGLDVINVVPVEVMPKTASGKIQRFKLANDFKNGKYLKESTKVKELIRENRENNNVELPESEMEQRLAEIWKDILKIESIGVNDNFFELGGNSLKASAFLTRIEENFNIEIPISTAFEILTIKKLAQFIEEGKINEHSPILKVEKRDYYPMSSAQKRLFILNQIDNDTTYNISAAMEIEGNIDIPQFNEAFKKLIKRHESLRTYFELVEGEPVQKIMEDVDWEIDVVSCKYEEVNNQIEKFIKPFDLGKAPLVRVKLFEISLEKHILVFDIHHIISDGISCSIMMQELVKLYENKEVDDLKIQYKDFALWQNKQFNNKYLNKQKEYWLSQYSDEIPVLNFPIDNPRPAVQSFEGDVLRFELPSKNLHYLENLGIKTGTTLYMILLSAYYVLLNKYTGQEDILVGTPVSGRTKAQVNNMIGMFVNTLSLRNTPNSNMEFVQFLSQVKENFLKAFENQDFQFDMLVDALKIKRNMDRNPMFDTMFVLQNMDDVEIETDSLKFLRYDFSSKISKFDITLQIIPRRGGLVMEFEYSTKLFKRSTIERLATHYRNILDAIVENPKVLISDIDILTLDEKDLLLNEYNNTQSEYPKEKTICDLFEDIAKKFPEQIAVEEGNKKITYGELNSKANSLAYILREKGVVPNNIVGIIVPRSIEMIVAIMGILKAGGAYLPINPELPEARVKYIIEDSDAKIILTMSSLKDTFNFNGTVIDLEDSSIYSNRTENLEKVIDSQNLAYTIYTSGSTGNPKGVMVHHQALNNYLHSIRDWYDGDVGVNDKCLSVANISFDANVVELFLPLVFGGTLVLYEKPRVTDLELFTQIIIEKEVTFSFMPPTILQEIYNMLKGKKTKLNKILTGVESIADNILEAFLTLNPDMKILNGYGPTETTICATFYRYRSQKTYGRNVPIGKPLSNLQIYLLDKNLNIVPIGASGELCISGDGVAKGYLNNPEMTNEKFIENPFLPGKKMYKTGDLSRWNAEGNLEFMGRADHQVKIRGYRIELGEIETKLLSHELIKEAVVIAREDINENKYLCAYIVSDVELTAVELKDYLHGDLPDYMIPAYYVNIERIPVTANGKIDRRALPEPTFESAVEYVAPRDDIEEELVNVWKEVLGVNKIGIYDNFFDLGGNSLKAIQVSGKLKSFGLSMQHIISNPTIAELSKYAVPFGGLDVELPEAMKANMEIDYYFDSEGERDPVTEVMDCGDLMLYFTLKKQVANIGKYYEYFAHGFDMEVIVDKNNNIYDMNCFTYHKRQDVFEITQHSGFGKEAMSHIEELLNHGEQVIIDAFCLRNPAFKEFVSFDAPEEKQRRGHVFMIVAHDEKNLYYVEMPDGINATNYVPYKGNNSVGIILKEKLMPAFEIEVYYATIKVLKDKLGIETNLEDFVEAFIENYKKSSSEDNGYITYYGQAALDKLVEISQNENLSLDNKANKYIRPLQEVVNWKFDLAVWRRRLFKMTLENYQGNCNKEIKEKVINLLEDSAKSWDKVSKILTYEYDIKQVIDKKISGEFIVIKEQEEQLMNLLGKLFK